MSGAYYNEFEPKAAAWLRELIKEGHIAPGDVDERSIADVHPSDLTPYDQCHFFAGIGGWSLALRLAGVPDSAPIWTGSCPCQPFSAAGKQLGTADERHLWPVFRELLRQCRPAIAFGEQVASKAGRQWLAGVFADLEGMAYHRAAADLCAASVGAPHIRQRLFWVAYADGGNTSAERQQRGGQQRLLAQGGGSRGLADTSDERWAQHERESRERGTTGPHDSAECRGACGLADADKQHDDRSGYGAGDNGGEWKGSQELCGERACRLVHSIGSGLEGHTGDGDHGHKPGRLNQEQNGSAPAAGGAWDSFDLLPCLDGKARRVESGTFPLAHGVSGRVGLLRGYGNAIVPQVAAEFIQAALEAIAEQEALA